ncbi:MAG: Hsp70 family protein [Rhizonema sp. PD38]|nr:Hsp70 family protein [Rhizonema sp. PD38]
MGKAIGIDLGTTNSVAAFKLANVEVVTAEDNTPTERKLMRSIVAYEQGQLAVGEKAYNQLRADPENTIVSIKRLMGRGFGEKAVQKQKSQFGYKITPPTQGTDNSIAVWLGNKEYQPEDIAAEILKKIIKNAQAYYQKINKTAEKINQAVITIPAYFNDKQRHATRTAALKAGLMPLELLPEPTAAAISYGFSPTDDDFQTILVFDFGGGTFDASVIQAAGTSFIELGKAGDLWLGGDDIDSRMIEFVKDQVVKQEQLADIDGLIAKMPHYQRVRFQADLKSSVERAKITLSSVRVARIDTTTPLFDELGIAIPIEVEITRHEFEDMIQDLVERSLLICLQAINDAATDLDAVDVVLLVGGCSQIPFVQHKVREAFGIDKVVVHPRPMYAVAEGAAIVAAKQVDKALTVSRDYFIQLVEGKYKVISRGDILPVTTAHTFKTAADGQRLIHFQFFSPDQVRKELDGVDEDEGIGDIWLGLNQWYPRGTEVLVNLELDEKNSDLGITAILKNNLSLRVSCTFSRGRSDETIYRELETAIAQLNDQPLTPLGVEDALRLAVPVVQLANEIIDPNTGEERIDLYVRAHVSLQRFQISMSKERLEAESFIQQCEQIMKLCKSMIPQLQQKQLQRICDELQDAIHTNDISKIKFKTEEAEEQLDFLPKEVKLIQACLIAIYQANVVAPTQASAMSDRLFRMVRAIESGDVGEGSRLWSELEPDISCWLGQKLPNNRIVTGLTR